MTSTVATQAAEAAVVRERIRATVDELQRRLSPEHMVGEVVATIERSTSAIATEVQKFWRTEPVRALAAAASFGSALLRSDVPRSMPRSPSAATADTILDRLAIPAMAYRRNTLRSRRGFVAEQPFLGVAILLMAGGGLAALTPRRQRTCDTGTVKPPQLDIHAATMRGHDRSDDGVSDSTSFRLLSSNRV